MIIIMIRLIDMTAQLIILLVIVSAILSYFMSPYHPIRTAIDRIVEPLLRPIRRVIPLVGMFDFSPLILIILVSVLSAALRHFLSTLI
ncbi:MAG: YggT family protein [Anaerolineales bacterium]|nr:YggT family protein [Anaerolineales bacterium]